MTEDIKPEVVKKTQDELGKYIKKPVLTEKLLRKPPFRFLHDICTSAMKETGFLEGVLNSTETKSENIKDKDGKIAFLQKVIAAVEAANGIKLTVKPTKIVAGHEPTKTNEFLQALGKALEKQLENGKSSKPSQQSKPKPKTTKKPTKDEPPDKKKSVSVKQAKSQKPVENGFETNGENSKNKIHSKGNSSPPKKISKRKSEKIIVEEPKPAKGASLTDESKNHQNGLINENGTKEESEFESPQLPSLSNHQNNNVDFDSQKNHANETEVEEDGTANSANEIKRPHSARPGHRKPSASYHQGEQTAKHSESSKNGEEKQDSSATLDKILGDKINTFNRSESVLGDKTKTTPSPPAVPFNLPKNDANNVAKEGSIVSRPRTGIRPNTSRPASARPAAPRIRDRGDVLIQEEVIKPASGKVQVIVEKETVNDHDQEDEDLVSLETGNEILLEEAPLRESRTVNAEEEHGHLVEQILESQKELEDNSRFSEKKNLAKTEIEWESGRNRESTNRQVERLRSSIQTLTRSANPLGKLLDFLQEDVDTMQRELENWRETNSNLSLQIAQERSLTEQSIEPLKIHLKELEQSIDQQLEQMSIVKANIIRNDQKINNLLTGI